MIKGPGFSLEIPAPAHEPGPHTLIGQRSRVRPGTGGRPIHGSTRLPLRLGLFGKLKPFFLGGGKLLLPLHKRL